MFLILSYEYVVLQMELFDKAILQQFFRILKLHDWLSRRFQENFQYFDY